MADKNRKYRRAEKKLILLFCFPDILPRKWDMSIIDNIGAGGLKFSASSDLDLKDKTIQVRIRIPELAPLVLDLEAKVVNVYPRTNKKQSYVHVKFVNLSEINKKQLSVLEELIVRRKLRNTKYSDEVN